MKEFKKIKAIGLVSSILLSCSPFYKCEPAKAQSLTSSPPVSTDLNLLQPSSNPLELPSKPEEVAEKKIIKISLKQALDLAFKNNPQLQIVKKQLEQAKLAVGVAFASYYPTLSIGTTFNNSVSSSNSITQNYYNNLYGAVGGNYAQSISTRSLFGYDVNGDPVYSSLSTLYSTPTSTFDTTISLNYTLFDSGRREGSLEQAREQEKVASLQVDLQKQTLELNTRNAYYDVQNSQAAISIAQDNLVHTQKSVQDTQALKDAGFATIADLLQTQVQLNNAQQQLVQAQGQLINDQATLNQVLGVPEGVSVTASDPIALVGTWNLSLEKTLILAFEQRPELKQQLAQKKISEAQKQVALSAVLPQISIVAQSDLLKYVNSGGGSMVGLQNYWGGGYSLSAQAQWNFFDGGAAEQNADSAEIGAKIAINQFSSYRYQIRQQVAQSFTNWQINKTNFATAQEGVRLAQQSLNANRTRYNAGVGTELDVITAIQSLNQSRLLLLTATTSYNKAIAALINAVGE